ncbi:MAG: hypothetical protein M3Q79_03920 [bacterium]|nr:hypothetical protein [bacterium]
MERPSTESMNTLGKALAKSEGVSIAWNKEGILIGDVWCEPKPLNAYLASLCCASEKVFFTPTQEQRDVLVLALGRTMASERVISKRDVITDEVLVSRGVSSG